MKFRIDGKEIDTRPWGSVDKEALWQTLSTALAGQAEGVAEAVKEVYAALSGDVGPSLAAAARHLPHHSITPEGAVQLNREGLGAAATALAGSRADFKAPEDVQQRAARHLLGHYRELKLPPPAELLTVAGEMVRLTATTVGEMDVSQIPLSQSVNLQALKAGDTEPLEVVVSVPVGKSRRGWNYRAEALQRIVGEVMVQGLPGFLGHQKAEDVDHQFPTPVTHWVGAMFADGKAYFRGVVDKSASDLKRWIKAGTVKTVSIFGVPTLQTVGGETDVIDYRPLSIDWTPLGRAGMPTQIVAMSGEMDEIADGSGQRDHPPARTKGGDRMTLSELLAQAKALGLTPAQIVGEMGWKLNDLLAEIRKLGASPAAVLGEMGWKPAEVWAALNPSLPAAEARLGDQTLAELQAAHQLVGEMAGALGLAPTAKPEELLAAARAAHQAETDATRAARQALVDKVIAGEIKAEKARGLVKELLLAHPDGGQADEAGLKKIVGEIRERPSVKTVLGELFTEQPPRTQNSDQRDGPAPGNPPGGLRLVRKTI